MFADVVDAIPRFTRGTKIAATAAARRRGYLPAARPTSIGIGSIGGHHGWMSLNPPTQYADDRNLAARQRLWHHQRPPFDIVGWVLDLALAGREATERLLDAGCGNGAYLRRLADRSIAATGCDLSFGMLEAVGAPLPLVNGDVVHLPFSDGSFDVVVAPHMLYHVEARATALVELRRVLRPGGVLVAVTNGSRHMLALRSLVEDAAREATPGWEMRNPSTHEFSLDNGADQLREAFDRVDIVRPGHVGVVRLTDAGVAAEYVASTADHYEDQVDRPWSEVTEHVRAAVQRRIDETGEFIVRGESGAFVCH